MLEAVARFFVRDAPLKIASLLLAVIIWYGAGSKQSVEFGVKVPLEVRNVPEDLIIIGDPPPTIRIQIRGRGRFLKFMLKGVTAVVDASECEKGVFVRPITTKDIVLPPGMDAEVSEVLEPRMLRVEVAKLLRRRVRIEPVLTGSPPEGFTIVGSPRVSPEEIELVGPEEIVKPLTKALLADVDLSKMKGMAVLRRRVMLAGLPKVIAEPEEVEVILTVEPIARVRFPSVPVRVESADRGVRASVVPSAVSMTLAGPSSVVARLEDEGIALTIDARRLDTGAHPYRTDIVAANRIVFLPIGSDSLEAAGRDAAALHRTATVKLPPQVEIVEILPSYFSVVVERGSSRTRR
ncbi:MAG: CdaR family protein [bacterium]